MANTNAPSGLKPLRHIGGGVIRQNEYSIASAYGTAIYTGDLVKLTGTGTNIAKSAAGDTNNIGVFMGCRYVNSVGEQKYARAWTASTVGSNIVAMVVDDPNVTFEIQGDSVAAGDIGAMADIDSGTGTASTGISAVSAAVSSATGTTGKTLSLLRLIERPDNAYGAYAKVEVLIAEHVMRQTVSGVGGV